MSIHLVRDLDSLHRDILSMCAMVEGLVHQAVEGIAAPSFDNARALAARDDEVDQWDVRIEEDCLKILALHQPVAIDLRRITAVMKISAELERVADLAVHIAERACGLIGEPDVGVFDKLTEMSKRAVDMLHRSIDAYVELDGGLARRICADDEAVDALNHEIIQFLREAMSRRPEIVAPALHLFSISRHLERVADHATNIAEDVVYLVEGEIIRHRPVIGAEPESSS